MTMETAKDFADEFRRSVRRAVQNVEREQVVEALSGARRIRAGFDVTRRAFEMLSRAPHLIERNLDVVGLPHAPATWIEIDDRARRGLAPDAPFSGPARVGYLLSPHPSDPGVLVAALARQIPERVDGACHLMPAVCALNVAALSELAALARRGLSRIPEESVARMVMHLVTYVPPGFWPEIEEFAKVAVNVEAETLHTEARRESAAEGVFLLALLVTLMASNVAFDEGEDGYRTARVAPRRVGMFGRALSALRVGEPESVKRSWNRRKGRPAVELVDV